MLRIRRYLEWLRPSGVPGAAAPAGVPVDRIAAATAELEPIFALLADCEDEAAGIRHGAGTAAERLQKEAEEAAAGLVEDADARVDRLRMETVARVHAAGQAERADMRAAAEREVARVRRQTAEQLPDLVQRVVDRVRLDLGLPPGDLR
ncbi:MAG: hypothetical protein ACRDPQ_10680 [Nocardioidaceae bacterium]